MKSALLRFLLLFAVLQAVPMFETHSGYSSMQAYEWDEAADNQSAANMMVRRGILMDFHDAIAHDSEAPVYCILGLGILLAILIFVVMGTASKVAIYLAMLVFLALCGCEVWQIIGYDGDITWFYSPSEVGWISTICNFVITIAFLIGQLSAFLLLTQSANIIGDRHCNIYPCLLCIPAGFVVWFILGTLRLGPFMKYAVYFVLASQACQIIYFIYANIRDGGGWKNLLFTIFFYIVGISCLFLCFFVVLPAVLLVWVLKFFLEGIQDFGNTLEAEHSQSNRIHIRESANGDKWYTDDSGNYKRLYDNDSNISHDLDGNWFDSDGFRH